MCLSVSAAWPIATEFDSDEGLRDITLLWVSWKIAGWMSRESKINLSSRDSCISIVRNQKRTIGMKVTGDRSRISSPSWACHWCTGTSLHLPFLYKLSPLTSLSKVQINEVWTCLRQKLKTICGLDVVFRHFCVLVRAMWVWFSHVSSQKSRQITSDQYQCSAVSCVWQGPKADAWEEYNNRISLYAYFPWIFSQLPTISCLGITEPKLLIVCNNTQWTCIHF